MSTITDNARKAGEIAGEKIGAASEQVREKASAARDAASAAIDTAKEGVHDALETTKAKAGEVLETTKAKYEASRAKATKAYGNAKKSAVKAKARTGQELDNNPLAFIAGGIAVGALIGALLPRTDREEKLLGPTGKKINTTARKAATAAKAEGTKKLEAMGISKDAAKAQVNQLLNTVTKAATEASSAAGKAAAKAAKKR